MPRQKSTYVEDPVGLARRLRESREQAGITQRTLAFPGCSAAYISRLEAGDRIPSLQLLRELGRRLGVSEEYLLTGSDATATQPTRLVDAEVALLLDDLVDAQRLFEEILAEPTGPGERIEALVGLGAIALREGRATEAVEQLEAALELGGGDPVELPALAENLGRAYVEAGELAPAIALFERCAARYEPDADPLRHIRFSALHGAALSDSGDHAGAEHVIAEALERGSDALDLRARARTYRAQARRLAERGEREGSGRAARKALETLRVTDDSRSIALAQRALAWVYLQAGRTDEAASALHDARPVVASTATGVDLADFEIAQAWALAGQGRSDEAAAAAATATELLADARPMDAGRGCALLADVYARLGDGGRARELLERAIELLEGQPQTRYLVDAYRKLGLLLEEEGKADEALDVLKRALAVQAGAGRVVA